MRKLLRLFCYNQNVRKDVLRLKEVYISERWKTKRTRYVRKKALKKAFGIILNHEIDKIACEAKNDFEKRE